MAKRWPVWLIRLFRALTAGVAYYSVIGIPGVTSSMVAIFVAVLLFDLMISLDQIRGGWRVWKDVVRIVIPRAAATAWTLMFGLFIGGGSAVLVYYGVPVFIGAVLTAGLSYSLAEAMPKGISRSVGIVGGLAIFHQTYRIAATREFLAQAGPVVVAAIYGTFAALVMGWVLGILIGGFVRLLLPRGYKSITSSAYEQPVGRRTVQEVLQLDGWRHLVRVEVLPGGVVEGSSLAALDLRRKYGAWVLRIDGHARAISLPDGAEQVQVGDVLLIYAPEPGKERLERLFRGEPEQTVITISGS